MTPTELIGGINALIRERDELKQAVSRLEDEVEELQAEVVRAEAEAADERNARNTAHLDRLRDAADILARHGYIHDTPSARMNWIKTGILMTPETEC